MEFGPDLWPLRVRPSALCACHGREPINPLPTILKPLTKKQLILCGVLYALLAVGGSAFLAARGSPELVPAALLAQVWVAVGLFAWYRVDESIWRPYLWPALAVASVTVLGPAYYSRVAPYAMTPTRLAPELQIAEMVDSLDTRLQTKVRLTATVQWWDTYPFGKGLVEPIKVRMFNPTGSMDVIIDRAELERDRVRLVGHIRMWEGNVIRVVALSVELLEPEPED